MEKIDVMKEYYDAMADNRIVPYFQPIFSIETEDIVSAEVLCRLKQDNGNLILPEGFIPILERTGEICDLDWYMLEKACSLALYMDVEYGERIYLSVNMSRRHVNEWDAVERLCSIVDSYCVDRKRIEIEITEGYRSHDFLLINMIDRIREAGFSVAADDFGKGYSTLSFLKENHVDTIKIDKSFINGNIDHDNTDAILQGILDMSDTLGISTIAEGVETEEQMLFLSHNGCSLMQGNYFSPPQSKEDFIQFYCEFNGCECKSKKKKDKKKISIDLPELPPI